MVKESQGAKKVCFRQDELRDGTMAQHINMELEIYRIGPLTDSGALKTFRKQPERQYPVDALTVVCCFYAPVIYKTMQMFTSES